MTQEETREKIVNAATELFMHDGCKRVTMDNVAARLHISKRTLYEVFANKEELLMACLEKTHGEIEQMHRNIHEKVDEPMLMALFMVQNTARTNLKFHNFIDDIERYYPQTHQLFMARYSNFFRDNFLHQLLAAQEQGIVRKDIDLDLVVETIGQFMRSQRDYNHQDKDLWFHQLNQTGFTFLRGLMTTEAIIRYEQQEPHFREILMGQRTEDPLPHGSKTADASHQPSIQ